jgi:hypothetical protein
MTGGVFISYRREDSGGYAGRIYDRLTSRLGPENVFFDVDTIPPGRDFVDVLSERVGKCDALLAVIGKHWVLSADSENARRLDDPQDFVRIEIEAALNRDVPVIPVLVGGAAMPHPEDLPDSLKKLTRRQAVEISHARFDSDAERLTEALSQIEEEMRQREANPPPSRTVQAEPAANAQAAAANRGTKPSGPAMSTPASPRHARLLIYAAIVGLIVAGAVGTLFSLLGSRKPEEAPGATPAASLAKALADTPTAKGLPGAAPGDRLDPRQIELIKAAAESICNTVKRDTGKTPAASVKGTVMGELGDLIAKMADPGSTATKSMSHDEFEGLTQDATAIALADDRECRIQLASKMIDRLGSPSSAVNVNAGNCSIAVNGSAAGNSISCGTPSGVRP